MKFFLMALLLISPLVSFSEPVKLADRLMIKSEAFGQQREILVSLPESYANNSNGQYPVIYVVRGQSDLLSVIAAIDMLDAEVPEFIVVGISGMGAEFILSDDSQKSKFSNLLHNEVVPYIQKQYRTAPYTILVGHSAAGKFVANDWISGGKYFSSYYAISPELNNGKINKRINLVNLSDLSNKSPLLITMGNESKRMQTMFDELKNLEALNSKVDFIQFEDQTHMSGRVHTVMAGLRSSFKNWRPSKKVESGELEALQAHYSDLSERYGYEVSIPLDTMTRQSAFHSASKTQERWEIASNIVEYALSKRPDDIDAFFDISDEMIGFGMIEGNKRLLSYICEQAPKHNRCTQ